MKIVHISTLEDGGAGRAAIRLHEGLLARNVDSTFLCAYPKINHSIASVANAERRSVVQRVAKRLGGKSANKITSEKDKIKRAGGEYEYYSLPFSEYRLDKNPTILAADVIHFHWISNFVDFRTFFALKKPIVWTFHDMNPFLGGFHYGGDLQRNLGNQALMGIEERYNKLKADALETAQVTVCAPSKWLYDASLASGTMRMFPHNHIPYGLDTRTFMMHSQAFSRQVFKLPADKKIFLFVSGHLGNKRKGFHLLEEAVSRTTGDANFLIVAVGYNAPASKNPRIIFLDAVHDDVLLPVLFSAVDVCVIPSLEDNLPNVMLESLCCGTPVIGFSIGGLKDVIVDGFNGFLSPVTSAEALADIMARSLKTSFDRAAIRRDSIEKFDESIQADRYASVYNSIF